MISEILAWAKQKGEEAEFLGEGTFWAWQNLRCLWDIQVEVSRRQLSMNA